MNVTYTLRLKIGGGSIPKSNRPHSNYDANRADAHKCAEAALPMDMRRKEKNGYGNLYVSCVVGNRAAIKNKE